MSDSDEPVYRRREVIAGGVAGVTAIALGTAFWSDLFGGSPKAAKGAAPSLGYGPRGAPDRYGIRLPKGFEARLIAKGREKVPGTDYTWHIASDGAATFATGDGGWILSSNSEDIHGGVSSIRFDRHGRIQDAYRTLDGTTSNCSGGPTPWGTWLSCEETEVGRVWETDPAGRKKAVVHPAMGVFKHEAAAVDPAHRQVFLTEDLKDGGLYRYTPTRWPDLSEGLLEVARVDKAGGVRWTKLRDPLARATPTRRQIPGMARFQRGEGIWFDDGTVYVSTTVDSKVHAYDTRAERIETIYDGYASREAPLLHVDQMTANHAGEVYVCEDLSTDEIDIGVIEPGTHAVSRFLSVTGKDHVGSELTGVTFDPSGTRMYFSSQRAFRNGEGLDGPGAIYEVTGPFRRKRA